MCRQLSLRNVDLRVAETRIVLALAVSCCCQFAFAAEEAKYFSVAEVDDAWWFVTPDGKPFFSSGVNVLDVGTTSEH